GEIYPCRWSLWPLLQEPFDPDQGALQLLHPLGQYLFQLHDAPAHVETGPQLLEADWLDDEVVGPGIQGGGEFLLVVPTGDHDDMRRLCGQFGPQPATNGESVEARHRPVEEG